MKLNHTVGVHDQVSWDAADLCWRWSGRTPTALAMPSSTRALSTGFTRPPSPGGVLVRASSGRLELRVRKGLGPLRLRSIPDASGESLVPFVCEIAHISISGSERRLGPRLAPRKAPRHRQPASGSASPDPTRVVMNGIHRIVSILKQ